MAISGTSLLPVGRQRALYNEAQKEYENYINYVNAERERAAAEAAKSKNKGGFLGGLGYLGEKIGLGFLSGIEGIWDFSAGGIAKLFGADDWAEEQFDDDWVNYNHADEWYNPSDSWKVAGDVAGGIGSSLPSVAGAAAGAAIIAASGGTLSAVGGKLIVASISAGIAGLGAAGNATKEAYRETGRLTGKEFGYGALSGATEAGIEFATAGIAKGTGRLASKFGNKAANETAQAVAKTVTKKGFFRELGEDFVTEAFEEGFSEFISPYYKRATYDPDAELASASEIAYASIIGGISGSIMTGVPATINTTANLISGKSSVDKGTAAGVLEQGRVITERENEVFNRTKPSAEATETTETTTEAPQATTENTEKSNATTETESGTGIGAFEAVSDTYTKLMESLKKHNNFTGTDSELIELAKTGNVKFNAKEMMQLGQLKKDGALARLHPYIERSAEALVLDADTMAQRYSAYGMTDTNGKAINVTAEQILSGIDSSLVQKAKEGTLSDAEARTLTKQLRKALKSNTVLSTLATAEATGNIFVDTKRMTESIINGENLASTADLNRVIEQGSIEEKRDLGKALGIQDWSTVTGDELRSRISYLAQNGGLTEYAAQSKRIKKALAEGKEKSKPLPHMLRKNMEDGVYRYTNEDGTVDMAILKDGENYYLYDYEGKRISRALTSKEINGILKKYWTSGQTTTAESMKSPNEVESTDTSRKVDELDALAFENIPEYKSLSEPNQAAIRMTLRQALANGLSEADALTMARFAAKSGLNVIFNASKAVGDGCFVGNTVYVNPNISIERTFDMVLGHEMFHAIFVKGGKRAMKLYNEAKEFIDSKKAKEVENRYKEFYAELKVEKSIAEAISKEEVSAHGSEEVFKSKEAWEYILGEDSSIGDGVLSFFRKSARKYSEIQQMSARARKFIRHYKKLFDAISARNQGSNSLSLALDGAQRKMPIVDRMGENVKLTGEEEIPRYKTPEEAKDSGDVSDARFSLAFSKDIANKQREYVDRGYAKITPEDLAKSRKTNRQHGARFALKIGNEDIAVDVEEKGDLLAIHNLTEQNLLDTLNLGGFPMPSIAIIRAEQEHSKYGDISVIFGRETIDPKNSQYNKVYGGDAWTATYPRIEYKANAKVAKRIYDKYYELEKKHGYDNVRAMYAYANEIEERLNGLKGEKGLLEEIYDNTRMMQVYLLDSGKGRVETVTKEIRKEMTPSEVKMNEFFIKELGEDFIDAYKAPSGTSPFTYVKEYVKENESRIKEVFKKYLTEEANIDSGVVEKIVEQYKPGDYAKLLRDAYRYRHEGAVTIKVEDDPKATDAAIRKKADNEQYREWVDSLFKGIQEKTGIRNSKDYYDNFGNSRSWEQLHYENTIDNVIRVMREQVETGGQTIFSGNSIWGVSAKEYKSIDELRADKNRLKNLPEEEYKAKAEELGGRLEKIAQSIKSDSEDNIFIAVDDAMSLIVDCVRECKTKASMIAYLKRYNKKATVKTVDDIIDLVRDIANMPTGYFEAKPRRAVDFSEIKMVELPDSASDALKKKLAKLNIPYEVYGNTDSERANAIRNLEDVRFALVGDIDYVDFSWYNEVNLSSIDQSRIQSEALIWDSNHRNELRRRTLSNGISYSYIIDDDGIVHVIGREKSQNIHERGTFYANTNREKLDTVVESLRLGQRNDSSGSDIAENRRKPSENDRRDNTTLRSEGDGNGSRYSENGYDADLRTETGIQGQIYSGRGSQRGVQNKQNNIKRNKSDIKSNPIIEFYENEDENTVTYRYANGEIVTERYALTGNEDVEAMLSGINFGNNADGTAFDVNLALEKGLPRKTGASNLTVGQMKKTIANNTHYKVFSKKNTLDIIGNMSGTSALKKGTRDEIADALWQGFNDCTDLESRQIFAHDMAEYITAKLITEAKIENPDIKEAQETLSYLSAYIGRITFLPQDIAEIKHVADKVGLRKILGRWGNKNREGARRVPMDVFVCDIAREMPGMSNLEGMHPVEAFMELDALYERAKENAKDKWISLYWDMPDSEILSLVSGIEADILNAFENEGDKSKFATLVENRIEYYYTRAEFWKSEYDNIKGRDRIIGRIMSVTQKMKDLRLGTFANSTQMESDLFKNSIEKLAKIQFRGNLNVSGTRKVISELLQWYSKDNKMLEYVDEASPGLYVQDVADMLKTIAEGDKGFSKTDLLMIYDIVSYFVKFVENYGKIFRNGKMIEALPEAQRYIKIAQENSNLKVGLFAKLAGSWYAEMFHDPASVVRRMDYYQNGFYTEMFEDLRNAAVDADVSEMEVMHDYDDFLNKNKGYVKGIEKNQVEYRGYKISKSKLIDLYMSMKRKQSQAGIAINGFSFTNLKGKVERVPGFVTDEQISETELEEAVNAERAKIEKVLTDTDREYIAIIEKLYNEDARKLKADRDMQRLGYTNATTDYYYPIKRAYIAQNVDVSDAQAEYERVSNASFNKDVVKGAKQELSIESVDARLRRHVHAVCQYAYLSPAIDAYNRLFNLDVGGNPNHPVSFRTESVNVWAKGQKYFKDLISDIQGIPKGTKEGTAFLSALRGSYAKFQLGANPKVWVTQMSSLFAASSILDSDSIVKGEFVSAKDVDEYCPLAKLRHYDNTAALAQGVIDKKGKAKGKASRAAGGISKVSDALMAPIGAMDRFVVCRLFGACQVQVAKNGGEAVGTVANKREAGKLLKKVLLETQQNSLATERSVAMRSDNEFYRTLTMFSADGMKVIGRVIDAYGEISVLKARKKKTTDAQALADINQQLKKARRKARKATSALVMSAIFMACIAQLFRHIYDKEQEDSVAETMLTDFAGNLLGGLPIAKDLYARIMEGYDFDNYAYSALNDIIDSSIDLFDADWNSSQDVAKNIKNLSYSLGQITGLPTRNIFNAYYGITKRFSPETAYKIDNVFYEKNYKTDFYKALEDDDTDMASMILSLLYNEQMGDVLSDKVHSELYSLSEKGYKVIPRIVPKSITVDEVEYELTSEQQEAIRKSYSASQNALAKLFAIESYKKLSDEMKAEAVNYIYKIYYDAAIEDATGIDRGKLVLVSSILDVEQLAILYANTKGLESDSDENGKTISGTKRSKIIAAINSLNVSREQKILMIYAKGYAVKDGDIRGATADRAKTLLLNYILRSSKLSKVQKEELTKMCGFEVKNGRILVKSSK